MSLRLVIPFFSFWGEELGVYLEILILLLVDGKHQYTFEIHDHPNKSLFHQNWVGHGARLHKGFDKVVWPKVNLMITLSWLVSISWPKIMDKKRPCHNPKSLVDVDHVLLDLRKCLKVGEKMISLKRRTWISYPLLTICSGIPHMMIIS